MKKSQAQRNFPLAKLRRSQVKLWFRVHLLGHQLSTSSHQRIYKSRLIEMLKSRYLRPFPKPSCPTTFASSSSSHSFLTAKLARCYDSDVNQPFPELRRALPKFPVSAAAQTRLDGN